MAPDSLLKNIDVLILCGGLGKRLRSVVGETQKVMASVDDRPFLDLLLQYLANQGFRRIILLTGYQGEIVAQHYQQNPWGLTIEFSKEKKPLGTGGAIKNAKTFVQSSPFFALNGDCFCAMDYEKFLKFHLKKKALATLSVSKIRNKKDFGSIVLNGHGEIQGFLEKTSQNVSPVVNTGIYCFEKEIFRWMPKKNKFSIETEFFPALVGKKFFGFPSRASFLDIGTPERYQMANKILKKKGRIT